MVWISLIFYSYLSYFYINNQLDLGSLISEFDDFSSICGVFLLIFFNLFILVFCFLCADHGF